jgi:hypothetical protein
VFLALRRCAGLTLTRAELPPPAGQSDFPVQSTLHEVVHVHDFRHQNLITYKATKGVLGKRQLCYQLHLRLKVFCHHCSEVTWQKHTPSPASATIPRPRHTQHVQRKKSWATTTCSSTQRIAASATQTYMQKPVAVASAMKASESYNMSARE